MKIEMICGWKKMIKVKHCFLISVWLYYIRSHAFFLCAWDLHYILQYVEAHLEYLSIKGPISGLYLIERQEIWILDVGDNVNQLASGLGVDPATSVTKTVAFFPLGTFSIKWAKPTPQVLLFYFLHFHPTVLAVFYNINQLYWLNTRPCNDVTLILLICFLGK